MKKSILFVYPEMLVGGSTTSLLSLLNELDDRKYEIDLLLYRNIGPLIDDIPHNVTLLPQACIDTKRDTAAKIKKTFLFIKNGYYFKGVAANFKYCRKLSVNDQIAADGQVALFSRQLDKKYDIAVGYLEGWSVKYVASDKVCAKKKIGWIHPDYAKSYLHHELDMRAYQAMDTVISVSAECEKNNRALFSLKDSRYVPNLLSPELVRKRAEQIDTGDKDYLAWVSDVRFKIITVCRISNVTKRLDRAVLTAAYLKAQGFTFLWYLIGDGIDRDLIRRQIEENDLQDCFKMVGTRLNPYPFIQAADLFVLPSQFEGKPMVITESMMLKVPAMVTEYASAREQINNGVDGIIVPNEDQALFEPMKEMLIEPHLVTKLKSGIKDTYNDCTEIELYDELFSN